MGMVASRIPKANYKVMWAAPSVKNPVPIKIVEPIIQKDIHGLSGSWADSTGGNIYSSAGGQIVIKHKDVEVPIKIDIPKRATAASKESIEDSLKWLDAQGAKIKDYIDPKLSKRDQAMQAVNLQRMIIDSTQNNLMDGNLQATFGRYLPAKSIEQFVQEGIAKGYSGDRLWDEVVTLATKHTSTTAFGCFAAGTLVHTDKGLVPIQDIKVGDMVLSKSEDGNGEVGYKPVLNTFVHENKELWMVNSIKYMGSFAQINAKKSSDKIRILNSASGSADFLATPNHPIWVVGRGIKKNENSARLDEVVMYPEPHWKRVDQLERYEVMVNADGVMYYIERAQPVYQFDTDINIPLKPSYMSVSYTHLTLPTNREV